MNKFWKTSLMLSSVTALSFTAACSDDGATSTSPECTEPLLACGEECVDKMTDVNHCGECGIVCDIEAGESCVEGQCIKEEVMQCDTGLELCGTDCVDIQTDNNNCGNCNIHCDTEAGESCTNGQCVVENVPECEDGEAPTCDGNAVKKCVNGAFETTDCGEQKCEMGVCIDIAECENDMAPICEGNAVKKCVEGKYQTEDCGSNACVDGTCTTEAFTKECEDTDAPDCDENNNVRACVAGKYTYQSCGTLTCQEGECQDVFVAECEDTFVPVCEENGLKKCVEGKFVTESCGDGMICKNDTCIATTIEDLCPDDAQKGGPGICGCNIPDVDADENGTIDCLEAGDLCPDDPNKTLPGICGCNIPDTINELSQNPFCLEAKDICTLDPNKTVPGVCGCNIPDTWDEWTMMPWCNGISPEGAPYLACLENAEKEEGIKYLPGACGCSQNDTLNASGVPACEAELKPLCDDPTDQDGDGVPDCFDQCPQNKRKFLLDMCDCDHIRVKIEGKEYCATPIETGQQFLDIIDGLKAQTINNSVNEAYILMNDIDLGEIFETTEKEWTSVDNFKGKLISKGKKIAYTVQGNRGQLNCTGASCGLFNSLSEAYINNIQLELNVKAKSNTTNTGVLAGSAASSHIQNIDVTGDVSASGAYTGGLLGSASASTLSKIKQQGNITSSGRYTGGVVGRVLTGSTLTSIESKGNIKAKAYTGGVFGSVESSIVATIRNDGETRTDGENAYTGGISGYSSSTMTDVISNGLVKGKQYVGGVTGYQSQAMTNIVNNAKVLSHNYNTNDRGYIGGIAGYISGLDKTFKQIRNNADVTHTCEPFQWQNYQGGISITTWACANVGGISGAGGLLHLESVENVGNIKVSEGDRGTQIGGIIGSGYPKSVNNVFNSGNITGAGDTGGIFGLSTYSVNTTASHKLDTVRLENILNTGNVTTKSGTYTGGIIGRYESAYEKTDLTVLNVVNTGNVTSGQYTGGIFGMSRQNGNTTQFVDMFSTGNVTGTNHVGGLFGSWLDNSSDCNGYQMVSSGKRTMTRTLNRAYAKGNVKGSSYIGGLIGSLYTSATARDIKYQTIICDADKSQRTAQQSGPYFDVSLTTNIYNVYATGNVDGSGHVGALIGYVDGSTKSDNAWNTYEVTYVNSGEANPCKVNTVATPGGTFTRHSKLVLANAAAAGNVNGSSHTGGLIGRIAYTNALTFNWNYIFNNIYATGNVAQNGGALFGSSANPTHIDYKNIYHWAEAASGKILGSGSMTSDRIKPFSYKDGTPILGDEQKLVNQLNENITNSTTAEVDPTISTSWTEAKHNLSETDVVNIPILEIMQPGFSFIPEEEPPAEGEEGESKPEEGEEEKHEEGSDAE